MIKETFSTNTWGPDGQNKTKQWLKFKEDIINARKPTTGSWISEKARILIGKQ